MLDVCARCRSFAESITLRFAKWRGYATRVHVCALLALSAFTSACSPQLIGTLTINKKSSDSSTSTTVTQATISGTGPVVADGIDASVVTITLKNSSGSGVSGVVPTFTATDTGTTNVYGACTSSDASGISTCTLKSLRPELKTLSVATPLSYVSSNTVSFPNGAASTLTFSTQPQATTWDTPMGASIVVTIQDAFAHTVTLGVDATASVALDLQFGTGLVTGTATRAAVAGVATFPGIGVDLGGRKVIRATKALTAGQGATGVLTGLSSEFRVTQDVELAPGNRAVCMRKNGQTKCWGRGDSIGQESDAIGDLPGEMGNALAAVDLGTGRTVSYPAPNAATFPQQPLPISMGDDFACAVLDNGTAKCWGRNAYYGMVGQGSELSVFGANAAGMGDGLAAIDLGAVSPASISSGNDGAHTCVVTTTGAIKCWGTGASGRLGIDSTSDKGLNPAQMGASLPAVNVGSTASQVAAGNSSTCALRTDGSVRCWGYGANGVLGYENTLSIGGTAGDMAGLSNVNLGVGKTAAQVAVGTAHTCAIVLPDQKLKCWGINGYGQLGTEDASNRGDVAGTMGNSLAFINLGSVVSTVRYVATGSAHTCAILTNDTVKCWGYNAWGQLGTGTTTYIVGDNAGEMGDGLAAISLGTASKPVQVAAGDDHTCVLFEDGTVKCWGANTFAQLGYGDVTPRGTTAGSMGASLPAVSLGAGRTARAIVAGKQRTCAALDNGSLKCWGKNSTGSLGNGAPSSLGYLASQMGASLPYTNWGTGRSVLRLASHGFWGGNQVTALLDDGSVKFIRTGAAGSTAGTMGDNLSAYNFGALSLLEPYVGLDDGYATCGLFTDYRVRCWGYYNYFGMLGTESTAPVSYTPLAPFTVNLGTGRTARELLTAAYQYGCAILDNFSIKCWGENSFGQLGQGHTSAIGTLPASMGDNFAPVDLGPGLKARQIMLGGMTVCALLDNAKVKCWGANAYGSTGLGDTATHGANPGEMGSALPYVNFGVGRTVKKLAGANRGGSIGAFCALLDDSTVKCWGSNFSGEIGYEAYTAISSPAPISLGTGRTVKDIFSGYAGMCAILDDASVKCWGENTTGEVGVGSREWYFGLAPGTMGDSLPTVLHGM